jgi:hypothetical protein
MRSFLFSCALGASLAPQAFAQVQVQPVARQMIAAEQRTFDFGTVARSAKTEHRFEITNIYQQDMHISGIRASCGCTTPIIETEWIKPGETGTILARFNTGTFTGQKQATLTVTIDRPVRTELQLNVRGYIRSDIVFNPGEVNFGAIEEGTEKNLEVTLDYAGKSDWKIVDIVPTEPFLKSRFEEVSRANGRVQYKIFVEILKNAPAGPLNSQIVFQTNDLRLKTVPLAVLGEVQSLLQVSPQALALGNLKAGEPVEQRFVVRSINEFRLLDVQAENMEVIFEPSEAARKVHLVTLKLTPRPAEIEGDIHAKLVFKTDLDKDATIAVDLTYRVVSQAPQVAEKPLAGVP